MKKLLIPVLFLFIPISFSCEELLSTQLSDNEIVEGLKAALDIGVNNSVTTASVQDGYLKNEIIKILLPPEVKALQDIVQTGAISLFSGTINIRYADIMSAYVLLAPNINSDPFEELVVAMNRGAEGAADKALPIFGDALVNMTISDALIILQGDSTAATDYFYSTTNTALVTAFQPDVKNALDQTKANNIYQDIVGFLSYQYEFNYLLGTQTLKVSDYINHSLPPTLDEYATQKATNGLFHLVGEEEKKIRKDPFAWASDIIAKVFGSSEANGG